MVRMGALPSRVRFAVADVASALPDLLLATTFLMVWLNPGRSGLPSVRRLVMIVLLEFFVVHSSGFMGVVAAGERSRRKAAAMTVGLALFYSLFLVAFSVGFHDWWLLGSFWLLTANRLVGIILGQAPDEKRTAFIMGTWAFTVLAYLLAVFAGVGMESTPLGITPEVVRAQEFTVGGLWTEQPQTALAAGAVYFAVVGLWELFVPAIIFRRERALAAMEDRTAVIAA